MTYILNQLQWNFQFFCLGKKFLRNKEILWVKKRIDTKIPDTDACFTSQDSQHFEKGKKKISSILQWTQLTWGLCIQRLSFMNEVIFLVIYLLLIHYKDWRDFQPCMCGDFLVYLYSYTHWGSHQINNLDHHLLLLRVLLKARG